VTKVLNGLRIPDSQRKAGCLVVSTYVEASESQVGMHQHTIMLGCMYCMYVCMYVLCTYVHSTYIRMYVGMVVYIWVLM